MTVNVEEHLAAFHVGGWQKQHATIKILVLPVPLHGAIIAPILRVKAPEGGYARSRWYVEQPKPTLKQRLVANLCVTALYFIVAQLSLFFDIIPVHAVAIWPAAGIALVALLIYGAHLWPGVFIGALLINLSLWHANATASGWTQATGLAACLALGVTLQALVGARALHKTRVLQDGLLRLQDTVRFYVIAAPASCLISATWSTLVLRFTHLQTTEQALTHWLTWWVGDSIGMAIVAPIALVLLGQPRENWRQRKATVAFPLLIAVILATALFADTRDNERQRLTAEFENQARSLNNALEKKLLRHLEVLYSVHDFVKLDPALSATEFRRFTHEALLRNPGIHAISWNPALNGAQLADFEKEQRRLGRRDFSVTERDKDGTLIPSTRRDRHVVVKFIEPLEGNEQALGFDIYSNDSRRHALDLAEQTRQPAVTDPITLVQENGNQQGILLLIPVFQTQVRNAELLGHVVGVYRIGELVREALAFFQDPHVQARLTTLPGNNQAPVTLGTLQFQANTAEQRQAAPPVGTAPTSLAWQAPLVFGQRTWILEVEADAAYVEKRTSWITWASLIPGFLFSALLGMLLMVVTGYGILDNRHAKALSEEIRLRKSYEEKYRLAMEATRDGVWDWDLARDSMHYSPVWLHLTGCDDQTGTLQSWIERVHPENRGEFQQSLQQHLQGQAASWQMEHRLQRADGSWFWALGRGSVVSRDAEGRPLRMIGTLSDISEKKASEDLICQKANYDALTLLPNRNLFHEMLDKAIQQARRNHDTVWLLFLDLDGFKEVNDTYGHGEGDQLLICAADRIRSSLRQADTVARLGGDEFVIILNGSHDIRAVDKVAGNILDIISAPYRIQGNDTYVTTSIGIAHYPRDADNADDLLKFADQAMYAAKREGKNRHAYFTPVLQQESQLRMQIASDLRKGIAQGEFVLYYQPIVDLRSGHIGKAEALIRWFHPHKGEFSPGAFIPLAEQTGAICDLGDWIIDTALAQLKQWQISHDPHFQLSINMSPLQLKRRDNRHDQWIDGAAFTSLAPHSLVLEITEGLLLEEKSSVNERLLRFRDHGIQVAIDDFGTGYSSLAYLKNFDIDYLKIDQRFTQKLGEGTVDASICEAIVVMAHKLGIRVIAEGVETATQKDLLTAMGCDYAQGYFYAKPLSAEDFALAHLQQAAPAQSVPHRLS